MKKALKKIFGLRHISIRIKKYTDSQLKRRVLLMSNLNIDTVFDVGANDGDYSRILRILGYKNRIISFEPLKSVFELLQKESSKKKNWFAYNYAIGEENTFSTINIAGNSYSSSILEMLPAHVESEPKSKYIGREKIEIKRLDSVFSSFCNDDNKIMLKIDTQGYEKNVIDGASGILDKISLIQLEMSIIPMYKNETLFTEMISYLDEKGFQLASLEDGFYNNKTGQLLQVDGIFVNKHLLSKNKLF